MRHPFAKTANPAYRRYMTRMLAVSAAYVAGIVLASSVLDRGAPVSVGAVAIALVPGLGVLGMIWAIGRLLVELDDEYLRMLEVRKALVATGVALALSSVWGLLEIYTAVPRLPVFWIFPAWCGGLGVGALVNRLALGSDAGGCP